MHETLCEFADSRGVAVRVDRPAGILRGVKILGLESRNGRTYLPEALAQAAALYEGAKVNVNHPKGGPHAPRDYQDRIGVIRNVAARADGLFADFHYNPKHALAEQLLWDAEHAPENVGFSHHVEARTARAGDRVTVEAILRVQSVDLVADPATTRGLFEAEAASRDQGAEIERLRVRLAQAHRPPHPTPVPRTAADARPFGDRREDVCRGDHAIGSNDARWTHRGAPAHSNRRPTANHRLQTPTNQPQGPSHDRPNALALRRHEPRGRGGR